MGERLLVVLDVGKTHSKLSLWDRRGGLLRREARPNARSSCQHYPQLDASGIEDWLAETLSLYATVGEIGAIIPVAHGAAAAVVRDGALAAPIMDYEFEPPAAMRDDYVRQRGAFAETGSPAMGMALNLGMQLHALEAFYPTALAGAAQVLPWPQYWAWRLSGIAVSEVTSWGSHTDLWAPARGAASELAVRRGWATRFAPRRHARDVVGSLAPDWCARTGLSPDVVVHVGLHDSNAALCGSRAYPAFASGDATLISTGTWFVSMRSLGQGAIAPSIPENRGCLFNVDVAGRPAPTALFMGGREVELLGATRLDAPENQAALLAALAPVVENGIAPLPTMAAGTGPFPGMAGGWCGQQPEVETQRDAAASLYSALMVDEGLKLIGANRMLLVEGRFANCEPFLRALATLRPDTRVFAADPAADVSAGAMRLVLEGSASPVQPRLITPLALELGSYRARWRTLIAAQPGSC